MSSLMATTAVLGFFLKKEFLLFVIAYRFYALLKRPFKRGLKKQACTEGEGRFLELRIQRFLSLPVLQGAILNILYFCVTTMASDAALYSPWL